MRTWQLTLRWRVAAAFGLGSLLISGVLAVATWELASRYMQQQRESIITRQTQVNVVLVARELRIAEPTPAVRGDPRRLERVVANLLDNADKYAGGPVRVAVLRRDGNARLEVDDAGPGVPPEYREQVFERFTRGPLAGCRGHSDGSGLGLALVAQQVGQHGGSVRVEDRPGGGARFVVELPETDR